MNRHVCLALVLSLIVAAPAMAADCGPECLEEIGQRYLDAYRNRDPARAPISSSLASRSWLRPENAARAAR